MFNNHVTLVGNLTDDPELRFTPSGIAVCRFRLAQTPRVRDGEQWTDGQTTFIDCTAWRSQAENIAESLHRGTRALVTGRLRTERWTDKEDPAKTHTRLVLDVDAIGAELTWATVQVSKARRGNTSEDQWATASTSRSANADQARGTYDQEPPF